jgi:hypothetical protein
MNNRSKVCLLTCKFVIFTLFLTLTGCYGSKQLSKSDLPAKGGNYKVSGPKSTYPMVHNAIVSKGMIYGRVNFSREQPIGEKYNLYVAHDSVIKINSDTLSVPLNDVIKIVVANDHYRVNKKKYDSRSYSYLPGDPYNPASAGIASLFIPGMGQMISGEAGRGLLFLGSFTGCLVASFAELVSMGQETSEQSVISSEKSLGWFCAAICIDLWSVADAVRVAKVNNLANRDYHRKSYSLSVKSFMFATEKTPNTNIPVGLSFKVTF